MCAAVNLTFPDSQVLDVERISFKLQHLLVLGTIS